MYHNQQQRNKMSNQVYAAIWREDGEEPYLLRSDECVSQDRAGDGDWWFDSQQLAFRKYYTYHDEERGAVRVDREISADLNL